MGFSDASDSVPTQTCVIETLPSGAGGRIVINLQAAKWQRVSNITVFIEDNHGADETIMHSLRLVGTAQGSCDVSKIKKC